MKKLILYTALAVLLFPLSSFAQVKTTYYGKVIITPQELAQHGDSLYVKFGMDVSGKTVQPRTTLNITPVLTDGKKAVDLPTVTVKSNRSYKEYCRQLVLMDKADKAAYEAPYIVLNGSKDEGKVNYNCKMVYEDWMENAYLNAKTDVVSCDKSQQVAFERWINHVTLEPKIVIEPYEIVPHIAYVAAEVEAIKHRETHMEAHLDFAVGKTVIRPDFGNNPTELTKIRQMIEGIRGDQYVTIRKVDVMGYASPEGSLALNKRLSEGRAKALQSYLFERYDIPHNLYTINFGGEDWDGLVKLVEASNMQYKEEVLNIIESVGILNGREAKIMALKGGVPYRYMLSEMFPSLRRVVCTVDYDVKNFTLEEAAEVIKTSPQNLSLNEMYTLANSYEVGSPEYNDIFETAVRLYPQNETAILNAASAALARKDLVTAQQYLARSTSKTSPEYENALGVLSIMQGNYDQAEINLKSAAKTGLEAAKENLDELAKKRENEAQIAEQEKK